jgi:membrane associated rhomboid family serine protease
MIPLSDGIPARRFPGGGTAFFAHIGGFLFGLFVARLAAGAIAREPVPAVS